MKTDVTSRSVRGKVNVRYNRKRGTYRLRFQPVFRDQLDVISLGLEKARCESDTEYDAVALTNICMWYLGGR